MQTCDYKTKPTLDSLVQQNDDCSGLVECSSIKKQTEFSYFLNFLFLLTYTPEHPATQQSQVHNM